MDGALLYVCMDWRHVGEMDRAALMSGLATKNVCVWVKSNGGMGSLYRSRHELVFVLKSGTAPHVEVDHDGHAAGTQAAEFATLVERLMVDLDTPENVARPYSALLARQLPDSFSAKTLNVARDATAVMRRIHDSSRQVTLDQLKEHLDGSGVNAIPEANLVEYVSKTLRGNVNSLRHMMAELGWAKSKVKWGGVDYSRAIWIRPEFTVDRGKLHGSDGTSEAVSQHLDRDAIDVTL